MDPQPARDGGNATHRPLPDGHDENTCRVRDILNRVGDKWTLIVIHELAWGPKRFTELKRGVDGVSQRMLTVTLRGLERDGLVSRTVHPVVPPRVDYQLTALGVTLLDTICQLMAWTLNTSMTSSMPASGTTRGSPQPAPHPRRLTPSRRGHPDGVRAGTKCGGGPGRRCRPGRSLSPG